MIKIGHKANCYLFNKILTEDTQNKGFDIRGKYFPATVTRFESISQSISNGQISVRGGMAEILTDWNLFNVDKGDKIKIDELEFLVEKIVIEEHQNKMKRWLRISLIN